MLLGNWFHVFFVYRQRLLRMRRGQYFFNRKVYREEGANKFIGYQVAGMTLSSFFFMASGLSLVLSVTIVVVVIITTERGDLYVAALTGAVPSMLWVLASIFATLIFQLIVNRCIFFVGPKGNKWIRFRFWYAPHDYLLQLHHKPQHCTRSSPDTDFAPNPHPCPGTRYTTTR